MKTNLVHLDRAARVGVGLFLFVTPLLELHTYPYNLLGLVLLATALVGYCPIYAMGRALFPKPRPAIAAYRPGGLPGSRRQTAR